MEQISVQGNLIDQYYELFFSKMDQIQSIEHLPNDIVQSMPIVPNKYSISTVIEMDQNLGIGFKAIEDLYKKCLEILNKLKNNIQDNIDILQKCSKMILCCNGELYTAWKIRLDIFEQKLKLNPLDCDTIAIDELHFNKLICRKFQKSSIAWHYRKLLLEKYLSNCKWDHKKILLEENSWILGQFLLTYPRNYHAWNYKRFLIHQLMSECNCISDSTQSKIDNQSILQSELEQVWSYCERNAHEFSAFHFIIYLLKSYLSENQEIIQSQITLAENLLKQYQSMYAKNGAQQNQQKSEINYEKMESLSKFLKILKGNLL